MSGHPIALTAVFLRYGEGYLGFIEEVAGVNAYGLTLEEARANLQRVAEAAFEEERRQSESMIDGKDVVREVFTLRLPLA